MFGVLARTKITKIKHNENYLLYGDHNLHSAGVYQHSQSDPERDNTLAGW